MDDLAKSAARRDRLTLAHRNHVIAQWDHVTAIAIWIGQVTVLADTVPDPDCPVDGGRQRKLRDSEGRHALGTGRAKKGVKRKAPPPEETSRAAGDLSGCARWEALRQRVAAKQAAKGTGASDLGSCRLCAACLI